jgi:DNA sulfur modification protein DndE
MNVKLFLLFFVLLSNCFQSQNTDITIYLIGDSTMADKPIADNPERGWGQMLPSFFDSSVIIENHAKNGRSTRSFLAETLWSPIISKLRKGDYVIIQFGHNDEKKEKVNRYTSPEDYSKNLIKFVIESREKEANPILCTPIMRRRFDKDGKFYDEHGVYPDIVRKVAKEHNVPLIDMHRKSERIIIAAGEEGSKRIFLWIEPGTYKSIPDGKQDNTHFSEHGARIMAELAMEGIKELNLDLVNHLKK